MRVLRTMGLIMALLIAACGGGGAAGTTAGTDDSTTTSNAAAATTVTTAPAESEDDGGDTVAFEDMPAECVDLFVSFLRAMEPALEGVDFETMTADDLEALGAELEAATGDYESEVENLDCPDVAEADEEAFAKMIEVAEREAPGTVAYLEWIQSFAEGEGSAGSASGDCETDIAAMEAIVAANESVGQLPMDQVIEVGALVSSITVACSPERAEEFFSDAEVAAFLQE
ncbi:MAG: hypothetical protein ACRDZM_15120 [Acidimicrobiia bacterium]